MSLSTGCPSTDRCLFAGAAAVGLLVHDEDVDGPASPDMHFPWRAQSALRESRVEAYRRYIYCAKSVLVFASLVL